MTNDNPRIRILMVSPIGERGGAEQVLLALAERLPQHGYDPTIACMRPGPLADAARQLGIDAHAYKAHRYRHLPSIMGAVRWLACLARTERAAVIHSNYMAHLYGGLVSVWTGIPEVWHVHDYPHHPSTLDRLCALLPSHHVIFTTPWIRSGYRRRCNRPHSVITPVCADLAALRQKAVRADVRGRHGIPAGPLLLTVARLQEHKGHRHLIDAAPRILQAHPNAMFAVVGKASEPQQEVYRQELLRQCERLGIAGRFRFLGYVDEHDLLALYREAAALIHPAVTEGFGLAVLEAMALGTPVIAASADGPRGLIGSGQSGILVPVGDSESLARATIRLLSDRGLSARLSQTAAATVAHLSVQTMVLETVRVYRQLAQHREARITTKCQRPSDLGVGTG